MLFFVGVRQKECQRLLDEASTGEPYDVIIVPGMPFDNGVWNKAVKARIYWAKYLLEKGLSKKVMFSGGAVHTEYNEAKAMALYAKKIGIPQELILLETKAEHSTQNVYYSYHRCQDLGYEKMALATDPFQAKMIEKFMLSELPVLDRLPFPLKIIGALDPDMIEPEIEKEEAIEPDFVSIKSRDNRLQRLNGTLGKDIHDLFRLAYPEVT